MSNIDMNYIDSIRNLGRVESKSKLVEYAEQFDVQLKKTKSFDNMVTDLENSLADQKGYKSTADMIDEYEKQDENTPDSEKLHLIVEDSNTKLDSANTEDAVDTEKEINSKYTPETKQGHTDGSESYLPEDFIPSFSLIGSNPSYYTLPWWLHEWILHNENWKSNIASFPHKQEINTLYGLLYYIQKNGSVTIRETRNSKYFTLT